MDPKKRGIVLSATALTDAIARGMRPDRDGK